MVRLTPVPMWIFVSREPAESPFAMCQEAWRGRWSRALSISFAVHLFLVILIACPAKPIFVKPNLLARGVGGTATLVSTPLYVPQHTEARAEVHAPQLSVPAAPSPRKTKVSHKRHNVLEEDKPKDQVEVGSRQGSSIDGPA